MAQIDPAHFHALHDGKEVRLYELVNDLGNKVFITNFGARVVAILVPDRQGNVTDVVLGFKTLTQYISDSSYQGAAIGRFANRIAQGRFAIDAIDFQVSTNLGSNCLHGGYTGFHNIVWEVVQYDTSLIILSATLPDGQDGFPGNLTVHCTYSFTNDNQLIFECKAYTDQTTIVNVTQHNYFNLMGEGTGNVLDHKLTIKASLYDAYNKECICEGDPSSVFDTPFDFRDRKSIGRDISLDHEQLKYGNGYDHNFHFDDFDGSVQSVAYVEAPNGITLEILTDLPCMQLYTSNWFTGDESGKSGRAYEKHAGFCLEPQLAPNAPNRQGVESGLLRCGGEYRCVIIQKFGVES
ncbi:MAG TPA: aldose epimerase family protein [Saprospiraceae bacterium]|nr:aldose epimerase family protein [Saprospiraceae bacterium]